MQEGVVILAEWMFGSRQSAGYSGHKAAKTAEKGAKIKYGTGLKKEGI